MAFGFQKKPKASIAEELAQLKAEKVALETERAEARQISNLKSQVKQDKRELRKLKSEIHPSIYRKLARGLVETGKESIAMGKEAAKEYKEIRKVIKGEKVHARKRRKVLRKIS